MEWSDTLQNLLLIGGGAVVLKLLEYISPLGKGALGRRRTELDRIARELALAIAEKDKQLLLKQKAYEQIYTLRAMMIRSGHWTVDTLPEEPTE